MRIHLKYSFKCEHVDIKLSTAEENIDMLPCLCVIGGCRGHSMNTHKVLQCITGRHTFSADITFDNSTERCFSGAQ